MAGLHFGPKAALLRSLLATSNFKNVSELKGFLTRITRESLRNVFTHSFIASDEHSVTFIHRKSQTIYSADVYKFGADDFCTHVKEFVQLAHDFEVALGILSSKEVGKFASFAIAEYFVLVVAIILVVPQRHRGAAGRLWDERLPTGVALRS